jgi:hypothetical protein
MDIEALRELLKTDLVTVVFTKSNGTKREMHCTMLPEYLPAMNEPNPNIKYGPSPTVVTVWDLEQNAWRSFKFDSLLSIETDYFNYVVER